MSKAAIYTRVSSTRQREEQTIVSQRAALLEFAAAEGLEIPEDWVFEDDGYSGATLQRPALERLRDLAAQVDLPVVLCHSPDRLARKYAYQVVLLEEFGRAGTEVRFLKGGKGDSAEAKLLLQFQGMIAEYEKAQIAERTRRGRLHRARQGSASVLSCAPYGYCYVAKRDGADARFDVAEHEASVVREIFRRYVKEPISLGQLARELSVRSGFPARRASNAGALRLSATSFAIRCTAGARPMGRKGRSRSPFAQIGERGSAVGDRPESPIVDVLESNGSRFRCRRSSLRSCSSTPRDVRRRTSASRVDVPLRPRCSRGWWCVSAAAIACIEAEDDPLVGRGVIAARAARAKGAPAPTGRFDSPSSRTSFGSRSLR